MTLELITHFCKVHSLLMKWVICMVSFNFNSASFCTHHRSSCTNYCSTTYITCDKVFHCLLPLFFWRVGARTNEAHLRASSPSPLQVTARRRPQRNEKKRGQLFCDPEIKSLGAIVVLRSSTYVGEVEEADATIPLIWNRSRY